MNVIPKRRGQGPQNRAEAWACFTANFALPGSGSLAAGRSVGYYQLALCLVGFIVSLVAGFQSGAWLLSNWSRFSQPSGDPMEMLSILWREIRWPLFGLVIFLASMVWGIITGMQLLAQHPKNPVPPKII